MLKNKTKPTNLPMIISDKVIGALSKKGKV